MLIKVIKIGEQEAVPGKNGKEYVKYDVNYKNLDNGKVNAKSLVSFTNTDVFNFFKTVKEDAVVEVKIEKVGNFFNWVEAKLSTEPDPASVPETSAPAWKKDTKAGNWETPEERKLKQRLIVRQATLNAAIATLGPNAPKAKVDEVLSLAERFEQWVYREEPVDHVKALQEMADDIPE